jgi:hypothetical protein
MLGDPPDEVINDAQIMFYVLGAFDFYAMKFYNAGKGFVEYKVTKTPTTKVTTVSEEFAFGQVGYIRRRIADTDTLDSWVDVKIADSISDLNDAESRGDYAVYFYGPAPITMELSWIPSTDGDTLELWGERVLFTALVMNEEVVDIPQLFHHLAMEFGAKKAATWLFKYPNWQVFARELKNELASSIEQREVILRNYLAGQIDRKKSHAIRAYNPMEDHVFFD